MTRARELKEKARLISSGNVVEKRSATITIRPLRLAFVININTSQETLIKYLAYSASIWGGIYNCLIPTDGQSLRDDWWAVLCRHDPDKVVFCGETTPELRERVWDEIQPFAPWEWYDGVAKEHQRGLDGFGNIPIRFVLGQIYEREKPMGRGYWLRLAQSRLAFRVRRSQQEYIMARLPEEERLFVSLLSNKGYHSHTTDKCRYTRGIIRLLGYKDAEILRKAGLRDLLYAMQGGQVYTPSEMKQFLKPGGKVSQHQRVGELVADLALKGVFLRGYNIQCPACDLRRWYSVHDVAESMECAGCLARLQPPIEAPFQYKLNELMVRGIKQGAIPLLLTILALSALGDESFLFLPGIEAKRNDNKVDIDLLAACNGNLVLAECKDLHEGCSPEAIQEIIKQLSGTVQVALEVGARIVFLSTLLDDIPQDLEQGMNCLREQHKDVAIDVMLKADLERGYKTKPAGRFLSPDDSDRQVPVRLEDLFPKRRAAKPGWVKEPGQRITTF